MPSHLRNARRPLPALERLEERDLPAPVVLDPSLAVRTATSGLTTPIGVTFLGDNDMLVLEKNTGQVKRVVDGAVQSTVLDLAVNFGSERGLLSIAPHPDFPRNPSFFIYWTESSTGADTNVLSQTPLLGNRVDRFVWNGSTLTQAENLIKIRAIQQDATNPVERGNHDGGVVRFGPDGKLYVFIGDLGRRGQMQNLPDGPFGPGQPDDQFGGPQPDDEHLSGVILRLNPDGSAPRDNPFFRLGRQIGGEVGANLQKVFSYGHRNSFGMAFDPISGDLWMQENGDDSFSELNRVEPGMNGGWVQIMGPVDRVAQFKEIETSPQFFGLQQVRWSPENIADTPREALDRLFELDGSHYSDPEFSWKFEVAPGGIGFLESRAPGREYQNDLFMGAATPRLQGGYLFHFDLTASRRRIDVDDRRLRDRVADNLDKHEITESESLLFGTGFGAVTDVQTGPNGNLFVVSLTDGAIYEIFKPERPRLFTTRLSGEEEVPPRETRAQGLAVFHLNRDGTELSYTILVSNLRNVVAAHLHLGPVGENGPVVVHLFGPAAPGGGRTSGVLARGTITAEDLTGPLAGQPLSALLDQMAAGNIYVNVHTDDGAPPPGTGPGDFPGGEIRGQVRAVGGRRS